MSVPVNVGISTVENVSLASFAKAGATRISLGRAMATATHTTLHSLSAAIFRSEDFTGLGNNLSYETIDDCMTKGEADLMHGGRCARELASLGYKLFLLNSYEAGNFTLKEVNSL